MGIVIAAAVIAPVLFAGVMLFTLFVRQISRPPKPVSGKVAGIWVASSYDDGKTTPVPGYVEIRW
jgi:hypothetical protein